MAIGGRGAHRGVRVGRPSLVIAIGDLVIDLQPPGAKDLMVSLFGDADKLVLNVIIVVGAVLIAAAWASPHADAGHGASSGSSWRVAWLRSPRCASR